MDPILEVVRVVLAPVPSQDVVEAATEGFVLPPLDASTLFVKRERLSSVRNAKGL